MTLNDIAQFLFDHAPSCSDLTLQNMVDLVAKAAHHESLFLQHREGKLAGVGVGFAKHDEQRFFVFALCTSKKGSLKEFLEAFVRRFPGYTMYATRHGKTKQIRYERILKKLK